MNSDKRKISKIVDELVVCLFAAGSDDLRLELKRLPDGFQIHIETDFLPEQRDRIEDLQRFLKPTERNVGLEEFCWELAGSDGAGQDSELHLIGQMIDRADVYVGESHLSLTLFKQGVDHS